MTLFSRRYTSNLITRDTQAFQFTPNWSNTAQKMKFSIKDFFSKCDQIRRKLVTFTEEILNGNFIFRAVLNTYHIIYLPTYYIKY